MHKGQYSLSKNKDMLFHFRKSKGSRLRYMWERYKWDNYPRMHKLAKAPLLVDVETSSVCNLKCPMCYTSTVEFKSKAVKKFMDFGLFKKIVDDCASTGVYALRLSFRGEPFMHPKIMDMIRYAKLDKKIPEVSTLTNGTAITTELFKDIMDAGLDWLTISFDGIHDKYEEIRSPAKFDDMYGRIKAFDKIKKEHGSVKPVIKVQTIWPQIEHDPQAYFDAFDPYVDAIAVNPLIDSNRKLKDDQLLYEDGFDCPFLWQRVTILSDGSIVLCINDEYARYVIGNAADRTISDIWRGKEFAKARQAHMLNKGVEKLPVCRHCYLPRKTIRRVVPLSGGGSFTFQEYVTKGAGCAD